MLRPILRSNHPRRVVAVRKGWPRLRCTVRRRTSRSSPAPQRSGQPLVSGVSGPARRRGSRRSGFGSFQGAYRSRAEVDDLCGARDGAVDLRGNRSPANAARRGEDRRSRSCVGVSPSGLLVAAGGRRAAFRRLQSVVARPSSRVGFQNRPPGSGRSARRLSSPAGWSQTLLVVIIWPLGGGSSAERTTIGCGVPEPGRRYAIGDGRPPPRRRQSPITFAATALAAGRPAALSRGQATSSCFQALPRRGGNGIRAKAWRHSPHGQRQLPSGPRGTDPECARDVSRNGQGPPCSRDGAAAVEKRERRARARSPPPLGARSKPGRPAQFAAVGAGRRVARAVARRLGGRPGVLTGPRGDVGFRPATASRRLRRPSAGQRRP